MITFIPAEILKFRQTPVSLIREVVKYVANMYYNAEIENKLNDNS